MFYKNITKEKILLKWKKLTQQKNKLLNKSNNYYKRILMLKAFFCIKTNEKINKLNR